MRVSPVLAVLASVFSVLAAKPMFAQTSCYTKTSDYQSCSAYTNSFGETACECAAKGDGAARNGAGYAHPGAFLAHESGRLLVHAVLAHSAAHRAGLRPGDEILAINGMDVQASSFAGGPWYDFETRQTTIAVRRGHRVWTVDVTSEGLDELVRVAWLGGDLGPAIYVTSGQPVAVRHKHLSGSFTYGLAWVERGSYLLVIDILRGSPAFKGSLRLGDKVASLNGVRIDHLTEQELAAMLYPQALDELEITIERAGSAATVTLKAAGISAVLRDVAEGEAWDTRPIHMALRTGP